MEGLAEQLSAGLASGAWGAVVLAYLGGILASGTPCIYPMIPITIGVIGANVQQTRLQSFQLSLVYVAGLAMVYGGLGVFAAATGRFFGEISTSPLGYFLVGNLCLFFGAWMMDWVQLPQFGFQSSVEPATIVGAKRWTQVFIMGCISGLVAAPCTAPILAILLTFIATTGNVAYGGLLMFVFAYGMGTLLIVIGTFTSVAAALPRSGAWMIRVKKGLALVMLGAGEYFLIQMGTLLL